MRLWMMVLALAALPLSGCLQDGEQPVSGEDVDDAQERLYAECVEEARAANTTDDEWEQARQAAEDECREQLAEEKNETEE